MKDILDLFPVKTRKISAKKYLSLSRTEKRNIESYEFMPPAMGSDNFGYFMITFKDPVFIHGEAE